MPAFVNAGENEKHTGDRSRDEKENNKSAQHFAGVEFLFGSGGFCACGIVPPDGLFVLFRIDARLFYERIETLFGILAELPFQNVYVV